MSALRFDLFPLLPFCAEIFRAEGTANSVSSIAQVSGPLIGVAVFEIAGVVALFLLSAALPMITFGLDSRGFRFA